MSGANFVIEETIKKFVWDENKNLISDIFNVELPFLQGEIDGLANTIQNRFYKTNFDDEQVLTSDGDVPTASNQINLYGYQFGIISLNMSIKSVGSDAIKALYTYDFGFEAVGGVYALLGDVNQRIIYSSGLAVDNLIIAFDIVGGRFQVSVNPDGVFCNASISIKVSSS